MTSFSQRVAITLCIILVLFNMSGITSARPQDGRLDENGDVVAAAIKYLQDLETKHAQYARPRLVVRSDVPQRRFDYGQPTGLDKILGYFILEAIDRAHSSDSRPRFGKRDGLFRLPNAYNLNSNPNSISDQENNWEDSPFSR